MAGLCGRVGVSKFGTFGDYPNTFAVKTLQKDFSDPDQDGPIRAAEFHPGNAGNRDRIRQDVATLGKILLGG